MSRSCGKLEMVSDGLILNLDSASLSGTTYTGILSNAGNASVMSNLAVNGCLSNMGNTDIGGRLSVGSDISSKGAISTADGILTVGLVSPHLSGLSIGESSSSSNSFLWHLGQSGFLSHWDLVGGDLRVTRIRTDVPGKARSVSYTLRVSDDDAFEIHQSTSNVNGSSHHRRVARFGAPQTPV